MLSTDHGQTFSAPTDLGFADYAHISSEAEYVYVLRKTGTTLYVNNNYGIGAFTSVTVTTSKAFSDVLVNPNNDYVYVMCDNPTLYYYKSTDKGQTFSEVTLTKRSSIVVYYSVYTLSIGADGIYAYIAGGTIGKKLPENSPYKYTSPKSATGARINLETGVVSQILFQTSDVYDSRDLVTDAYGNVVDGFQLGGASYYSASGDQGTTWETPVSLGTSTSHNECGNTFTNDYNAIYVGGGQVFSNVYGSVFYNLIETDTEDAHVCVGDDVTFQLTASGTGTIYYQWEISTDGGDNFSNITDETTNTLIFTDVQAAIASNIYRCKVTDNVKSVYSRFTRVYFDDQTATVPDETTLPDVTAQCSITSLTAPTATDNCGGTVTVTNDATLPITAQGTTVVTWTYEDANGNTSTQEQNIVIEDNTAPVADIENLPDVTAECTISSLTAPTATDNCGGTVTVTNDATLPITAQGTTVVTWSYEDENGNISTQEQNVVIEDITNPVAITQNISVNLDADGNATITPEQINDNSSDNCGIDLLELDMTSFTGENIGENTVTLTVTDNAGNTDTETAIVTVGDEIDPTVVGASDVVLELDENGNITIDPADLDGGSSDNCDFTLSVNPTSFDCADLGEKTVTLTATDCAGNTASVDVMVMVEDNIVPEITCPEDMVVTADNLSQDYTVPGTIADASATDNCDAVLTNSVNSEATLAGSIFHQGQYTITWTATDADGNETSCSFTLTVNEFVSVNDISQSKISIYPNPANDFTMIEANGRVEISDISGKKLMTTEIKSGEEIDLSSLTQGIYFVTIIEKDRTQTTKLIKK